MDPCSWVNTIENWRQPSMVSYSPLYILNCCLHNSNMVPPRDYGSVKYRKLSPKKDDSFDEQQFEQKPPRIPWKAIIFAFILLIFGSGLLIMALLISAGLMDNEKYEDRSLSLMILGFLMFLPGAYHVRIAYHALRGHPSYSFDDIPEFQ
ncbi:hypothetical protein GE061_007200 [Apolygus lucorum]|uniref:Transmembrane protein 230 n=1 Tax=Apolygus lucorum TaxID=248454 RepID=A0A8S9WUY6_APOLU|nr:hypothetical protein GE061_007200 [Apolygus lucorum]